jgi:hypothetical protein
VIVYGTGWYYSPWVGSVWYGAPVTWGFGFTIFNSWWNPWWRPWGPAWGFAFAPVPCLHPWWGPWHRPVPRVGVAVAGAVPLHGRAVAPINANGGAVRNFNRSAVNVTHLYGRWGSNVVLASSRSRAAPPTVSAVPITAGARNRSFATIPPAVARSTQPAQAQSPARAAQAAAQSGADVISSSDGRVYRRAGRPVAAVYGQRQLAEYRYKQWCTAGGQCARGSGKPGGRSGDAWACPIRQQRSRWRRYAYISRGYPTVPEAVQSSPAIAPVRSRPFSRATAAPSSFPRSSVNPRRCVHLCRVRGLSRRHPRLFSPRLLSHRARTSLLARDRGAFVIPLATA